MFLYFSIVFKQSDETMGFWNSQKEKRFPEKLPLPYKVCMIILTFSVKVCLVIYSPLDLPHFHSIQFNCIPIAAWTSVGSGIMGDIWQQNHIKLRFCLLHQDTMVRESISWHHKILFGYFHVMICIKHQWCLEQIPLWKTSEVCLHNH